VRADEHLEDESFRREVCDWLTLNGVSPMLTPMDCRASVADGRLTILQKVQRDGHDVLNPADPNTLLTETLTVPVIVPAAGAVAKWLEPRCPICGR
jgi:hypothetical protein